MEEVGTNSPADSNSLTHNTEQVDSNFSVDANAFYQNTNIKEPVYVVKTEKGYNFVDQMLYKLVMKQQKFDNVSERDAILAACPKPDTSDGVLEIVDVNEQQLAEGYHCNEPVKFFVKQQFDYDHYLIGFMVHDKNGIDNFENIPLLPKLPKDYFPLPLIEIESKFKDGIRSLIVKHTIKFGDMLPAHPYQQFDQNSKSKPRVYYRDMKLYPFYMDEAYTADNQAAYMARVGIPSGSSHRLARMQLVPEADLFFEVWKQAAWIDSNTIPVWDNLIPEWNELEEFVRRVAKVVGDLNIITVGTYPGSSFDVNPNTLSAYQLYFNLPVFHFIFKAISFDQLRQNGDWVRQGIIFMMVNHPDMMMIGNPDQHAESNGWVYRKNNPTIRRTTALSMGPAEFKVMQLKNENSYETFNLRKVRKFIINGNGVEEEIEINAFDEIMNSMKNMETPEKNVDGMVIS
ncbi:uncharacterized protein LOC135848318 isoform X2 [Planococcus citri]